MKNAIVLVCLIVSCCLQAQVGFNPGDLDAIACQEQKAGEGKLFPVEPANTANYDVKWYRCRWNINPAIREISGNVTTMFLPAAPGLDSLILDLSQVLTVDSVIYHGLAAPWGHSSGLLTVHFSSLIPPGNADSVTVYYHGVPPENGFGSFTQSTHNGIPVIWTLSEPYGSSDWWPCKNGLTDKADSIDIYIRTPSPFKAASNGILVSADGVGTDIVYHWKHRFPIAPYLVCLAVSNYAVYSHQVPFYNDTLRVINYIYPEDSAAVATQTGAIVPMIQLYDTLFGVYPFQEEKYGHVQFGWGGGMEHQTMTFVTSFGFELLAHELAHQWFGDKVTCGSWADIWLNEGFATYLSGLCYEHLAPEWWKRFREVRVQGIVSQPGGSVYCPDTTSIARIFDGRLSYAKGAMILHQLRWIIGDSAFYAALRGYLSDVSLAYGFARTAQLKTHLENASGQDLTWYFNDWYTGEGFPSYHINWSQNEGVVSFSVKQTQSHPSVAFFKMPIPVEFKNATRDTIIRFSNTFSGQTFSVTVPFKIDSVLFDPGYQLISGNNSVDGLVENVFEQSLQIYPNPASTRITFQFYGTPAKGDGKISIYDPAGHVCAEQLLSTGETGITFFTGNYLPGLYFYTLQLEDYRVTGKFMIMR